MSENDDFTVSSLQNNSNLSNNNKHDDNTDFSLPQILVLSFVGLFVLAILSFIIYFIINHCCLGYRRNGIGENNRFQEHHLLGTASDVEDKQHPSRMGNSTNNIFDDDQVRKNSFNLSNNSTPFNTSISSNSSQTSSISESPTKIQISIPGLSWIKKEYNQLLYKKDVQKSMYIVKDTKGFLPTLNLILENTLKDTSVYYNLPPTTPLDEIGILIFPVYAAGCRTNVEDDKDELEDLYKKYGERYEIIYTIFTYGERSNIKGLHSIFDGKFTAINFTYSGDQKLSDTVSNQSSMDTLRKSFESERERYEKKKSNGADLQYTSIVIDK